MDNEAGCQSIPAGESARARRTPSDGEALLYEFWSRCRLDRRSHASSADQVFIGSVDDRINWKFRDIGHQQAYSALGKPLFLPSHIAGATPTEQQTAKPVPHRGAPNRVGPNNNLSSRDCSRPADAWQAGRWVGATPPGMQRIQLDFGTRHAQRSRRQGHQQRKTDPLDDPRTTPSVSTVDRLA